MRYSAKVPIIINYTIVAVDTWEQITGTPVKGVRRWFVKTRESTDNAYDLAFGSTQPTGSTPYLTSDGLSFDFDECDLPTIWVRTSTSGTVFELNYWS